MPGVGALALRQEVFHPQQLANYVADFDAMRETYNEGDAIATIKDWSPGVGGTPRDLTQATAGSKPTFRRSTKLINGRPTFDFDGGDFIQYTTSFGDQTPTTHFFVLRTHSSLVGAQNVLTGLNNANTNGVKAFYIDNTFPAVYAGTARLGAAMSVSTNYFVTVVVNGGTSVLRVNASNNIIATVGTFGISKWTVGRNALNNVDFFFGQIGRILCFNRALPLAEILLVEKYLRKEWAV